jgi:hypothetical protein
MKKITYHDLESILGFQIDDMTKNQIINFDLTYRDVTDEERDNYILSVINVLTNDIVVSGKHRIQEWENGWGENLNIFKETGNIEDLIPKYHGKNRIVRWMGDVIMPITENFDYKIHICFVDAILRHYINNYNNVFELGCGPSYHLIRQKKYNEQLNLFGSDWAKSSQEIISEINKVLGYNIKGFNLNFFEPETNLDMGKNSLVYTVAALEQIGPNFENFINFIIKKKPGICIHLEPIDELLNENKLIDNLSIKYFRKRNYLKNFLPYLENLEKNGKIEIIKKQRIFSGSYFIEGHSLIIWKPI